MGMSSYDFHCLTAAEYILAVRGYDRRIIREWEHTRLIGYTNVKPNQSLTSWMPLPTDSLSDGAIDEETLMKAWAKAKNQNGAGVKDKD